MGRISSVVVALLLLLVELVVGVRLSLLDGPVGKQMVNWAFPKGLSLQSTQSYCRLKSSRKAFVTAERYANVPQFLKNQPILSLGV